MLTITTMEVKNLFTRKYRMSFDAVILYNVRRNCTYIGLTYERVTLHNEHNALSTRTLNYSPDMNLCTSELSFNMNTTHC